MFPSASRIIFSHIMPALLISGCSHHIGSGSNPSLGSKFPGCLLDSFLLHIFFFLLLFSSPNDEYSNLSLFAQNNWKSLFPHLYKEIYAFHPFCWITNSWIAILVCLVFLLFDSYLKLDLGMFKELIPDIITLPLFINLSNFFVPNPQKYFLLNRAIISLLTFSKEKLKRNLL